MTSWTGDLAVTDPMRRALVLGALGVVYGDIGTSPIYTLRECLKAAGGGNASEVVLGLLSLVFWALMIVVTTKYVLFVMRADNDGAGGIMALAALARRLRGHAGRTAAELIGIDVERVQAITFGLGTALAGAGGIAFGATNAFHPASSYELISRLLVIIILVVSIVQFQLLKGRRAK